MTTRLPRLALAALLIGLAFHNLAMALLWQAGVRDLALDVVAAWKEALLLVALVAALAASGAIPRLRWADRFALAYGALVVVYWLLPQAWLGGEATARGELYALRHHLLPLGAYLLGRLVVLERAWWRRLLVALVAVAVVLAVWGLVDVYAVPLDSWRDSGVPGWFGEQLGLAYECLSGLPENWILNTDEESPARRLVSTFLSPLATAYLLVVALLLLVAARPRRWTVLAGVVIYAGLLWTHTRAAFIALPVGLLVLAALRRSWRAGGARGRLGSGLGRLRRALPHDRARDDLHAHRARLPSGERGGRGGSDRRSVQRRRELDGESPAVAARRDRDRRAPTVGVRARELRGVGVTNRWEAQGGRVDVYGARRRHRNCRAGGVRRVARRAGLAVRRRSPWLAASLASVAVLGLQTDVIGIHWLAVVVFALAGAALRAEPDDEPPERTL